MRTAIHRFCLGILPVVALLAACSKNEEPPKHIGQQIPYTDSVTQTLSKLVDSLPGITIYKAAWQRGGMDDMLNSLRGGNAQPYTLFIPSDKAFTAAGITLAQVSQWPVPQLDSLLLYLCIQGQYATENLSTLTGNMEATTPLSSATLKASYPAPDFSRYPYIYRLYLGWVNNTLQLNGINATQAGVRSIAATDGFAWMIDTLIRKPEQDAYQLLTADTSFSFYMTVLRYSDKLYQQAGVDISFRDTLMLQLTSNRYFTFLPPVNNAFRKAGFQSISDITTYLDKSQVGGALKAHLTNLDSVVSLHTVGPWFDGASYNFFGSGGNAPGLVTNYFLNDLLYNPSINDIILRTSQSGIATIYLPIRFSNNNGQLAIHRKDYPGGREVHVTALHDIHALNGVIHAVDDLLLPQP